jgi:sugar O-acyltransferase (sialic acid O-acetyltransferase NeuD family)
MSTALDKRWGQLPPEAILWGGTGQAKVVRPILEHWGCRVVAVIDDTAGLSSPFGDVPIHLGWAGFQTWLARHGKSDMGFCVAIGNPHGRARLTLHERLEREGLRPVNVVHPTAWVASNARVGEGVQLMAGSIVGAEARLGRQCIINTKASIDHEDVLEDGVEIAPGATLCGAVHVKTNAWICAGATVLPRITIGENAIVGAGAVVTRDVSNNTTVCGIPARPLKRREE